MRKIIMANWKMKLNHIESIQLAKDFVKEFKKFNNDADIVICPNFLSLTEVSEIIGKSKIKLGSQSVFWEQRGAYTGEISAEMLKEVGCEYIIIGHSERRKYLLENYEMIHQKLKAVLDIDGLTPVVCIGEEAEDRKTDKRDFVLVNQLQQALGGISILENQEIIIAYEPIWAIGSGIAIEPEEAEYAHKIIKLALNDIFGLEIVKNHFRVIYGGSVSSKNVKSFKNLENLDGFLVGGASLEAKEFYKIAQGII